MGRSHGDLPQGPVRPASRQDHRLRHDQERMRTASREVFEEMYPQHVGLVQVITSTTERVRDGSYGDGLITKFKKNNLPRIAISVDMLDTGIDVPEVVQSRLHEARAVAHQALANDRPRHAQSAGLPIPRPPAGREKRPSSRSSISGKTTSTRRPTTNRPQTCRCSCRSSIPDSKSSNVTCRITPPRLPPGRLPTCAR